MSNIDIESLLDSAEQEFNSGFTSVPDGKYKLRVVSPKTKVTASKKGERQVGFSLVPVETETGESVNGSMIYHKFPLEGEFTTTDKATGVAKTQPKLIFLTSFLRNALGLSKDDSRAAIESILETATGEHAQIKTASGEYFDVKGKEVMGTIVTNQVGDVAYTNIKRTWAIK